MHRDKIKPAVQGERPTVEKRSRPSQADDPNADCRPRGPGEFAALPGFFGMHNHRILHCLRSGWRRQPVGTHGIFGFCVRKSGDFRKAGLPVAGARAGSRHGGWSKLPTALWPRSTSSSRATSQSSQPAPGQRRFGMEHEIRATEAPALQIRLGNTHGYFHKTSIHYRVSFQEE